MKKLLLIFLLFIFQQQGSAQDSLHADSILRDYLFTLTTTEFGFDAPGDGFDRLSDGSGFICLSKKAVIKYIIVPVRYERAMNDIREKKGSGTNVTIVDTFSVFKGDRQLLFSLSEDVAPLAKNEENMYMLITFMQYTANVTLGIVSTYPKSRDAEIRKKIVDISFTLHKL